MFFSFGMISRCREKLQFSFVILSIPYQRLSLWIKKLCRAVRINFFKMHRLFFVKNYKITPLKFFLVIGHFYELSILPHHPSLFGKKLDCGQDNQSCKNEGESSSVSSKKRNDKSQSYFWRSGNRVFL